ncbi:MAG: hypothetical protein ACRDZP_06745, partial [Acidimicrobiales bacterium]
MPTGAVASASTAPPPKYVSTTGHDSGGCWLRHPCATIKYALTKAAPGATIHVAAGTYHQTVQINQPVTIAGAGASKTVLDGAGLDPGGSYYGIVFVGNTSGSVTVSGFSITNPFPYAYTAAEPEAVALANHTTSASVTILDNVISEGTAPDPNRSTDFPIGIDTFQNSARTTIRGNTIEGFFQGALIEDNGPANVVGNTFKSMIANHTGASTSTVTYPGEGVFFLSDLNETLKGQNANHNLFTGYGGLGLIAEAGYNNGNCTTTPCNGSIQGNFADNSFSMKGATGGEAIDLKADYTGNTLT